MTTSGDYSTGILAVSYDGDVTVTGWVETGARGADLVVHVEPRGAAKLVAEPGVTVTPLPRDGLTWPGGPAARA